MPQTKVKQSASYCGANAHFQNGITERRIRDLQDKTRTMLVHARHRWPDVITANLMPYALRLAIAVRPSGSDPQWTVTN